MPSVFQEGSTQPEPGRSGGSGSFRGTQDWADAGLVKVKLAPVLWQALAELGLGNNILIQLQIRLDRSVRELVWIQFWLEENTPLALPHQLLLNPLPRGSLAWSTNQGVSHGATATLLCHTQGWDEQVTSAYWSDGKLVCPKTPRLAGPGKVKGLHPHRWGAGAGRFAAGFMVSWLKEGKLSARPGGSQDRYLQTIIQTWVGGSNRCSRVWQLLDPGGSMQ